MSVQSRRAVSREEGKVAAAHMESGICAAWLSRFSRGGRETEREELHHTVQPAEKAAWKEASTESYSHFYHKDLRRQQHWKCKLCVYSSLSNGCGVLCKRKDEGLICVYSQPSLIQSSEYLLQERKYPQQQEKKAMLPRVAVNGPVEPWHHNGMSTAWQMCTRRAFVYPFKAPRRTLIHQVTTLGKLNPFITEKKPHLYGRVPMLCSSMWDISSGEATGHETPTWEKWAGDPYVSTTCYK